MSWEGALWLIALTAVIILGHGWANGMLWMLKDWEPWAMFGLWAGCVLAIAAHNGASARAQKALNWVAGALLLGFFLIGTFWEL